MSVSLQRTIAIAVALGACLPALSELHAAERSWHIGAGVGISKLTPDTDGSSFSLIDDQSTAAGVYLGLDINRWLSAEIAFTDLGTAELSDGASIEYSAISLGGVAYLFGERDSSRRQDGAAGYLRLGFNQIDNDANIELDEANNNAIWAGAGVQWPLAKQWGVRGEITSFDGDAHAAMVSLYWRPTSSSIVRSPTREPVVGIADSGKSVTQENDSRQLQKTVPESVQNSKSVQAQVATPTLAPTPAPEAVNSSCIPPGKGEPVDSKGCGLFSGALLGVEFSGDSSSIQANTLDTLDSLAKSLKQYPDVVVEIRVHTQAYKQVDLAKQLSRERAVAIARHLVGQGISVKRLRARAFGSTQPITDNGDSANNRVVLRVL
ncbi:MAG: OmpA family protein [Granulosicoccus sp.]